MPENRQTASRGWLSCSRCEASRDLPPEPGKLGRLGKLSGVWCAQSQPQPVVCVRSRPSGIPVARPDRSRLHAPVSAEDVDRRNGGHFRLLFDNQQDEHQLHNLFGEAESRGLQRRLHQRLCKAILAAGEELPDFVIERSWGPLRPVRCPRST